MLVQEQEEREGLVSVGGEGVGLLSAGAGERLRGVDRRLWPWCDGHLDIAYLALEGRDVRASLGEATQGPQPPSITFPALKEGHVQWALATIFPVPKAFASYGYAKGDIQAAHQQGIEQLKWYHLWEREGWVKIARDASQLTIPVALPSMEGGLAPFQGSGPLEVILLMEGATPVRTPEEIRWWFAQGVRVVGLSWAAGSPYAGGNYSKGPLTERGIACVAEMDALGMIHDLSHLSDEAAWRLLEVATGPVVATHSNSRMLMEGEDQRHLSDDLIKAIEQRGGVVGLNLFSRFLSLEGKKRRASLAEAVAHVEHICDVMGHRRAITLGSDMDGGFGANQLPAQINRPDELWRLLDALSAKGWGDDELLGFSCGNWLRFLKRCLP